MNDKQKDWFHDIFGEFDPDRWARRWQAGWGHRASRHGRRRTQMFESGEMKYVILRLLREQPRHGYDIIKALEERFAGCYTPSPGTVYPTLELLADQGLVRAVEKDGRKVYHITPEGEAFLDQHKDTIEEIFDRVRDTVRDVAGGAMGDLSAAFARLAKVAYRDAWRVGPDDPRTRRVVEILERTTEEIRAVRAEPAQQG
jgi:DNA-binding PadR family transcriptional regulator